MVQEKYTNAFLGFGPEGDRYFALELTYNYGAPPVPHLRYACITSGPELVLMALLSLATMCATMQRQPPYNLELLGIYMCGMHGAGFCRPGEV